MAKSMWFHVTGIDKKVPEQNRFSFYSAADSFYQHCSKTLPSTDQCKVFVNTDKSLVDPSEANELTALDLSYSKGHKSRDELLKTFADALDNAQKGDQIVFSLKNHGAPSIDQNSPSCIYIDENEAICENDLAKLINDQPKRRGFKVFIVADGCYSGGFLNLANENVCPIVSGSQFQVSHTSKLSFWSYVHKEKPALVRQAKPRNTSSSKSYYSPQDIHFLNGCNWAKKRWPKGQFLSHLISHTYALENSCSSELPNSDHLNEISSFLIDWDVHKLQAEACAKKDSNECEFMNRVQQSKEALLHLTKYSSEAQQSLTLIQKLDGELQDASKNLNLEELQIVSYLSFKDLFPGDERYDSALKKLENFQEPKKSALKAVIEKRKEAGENFDRKAQELNQHFSKVLRDPKTDFAKEVFICLNSEGFDPADYWAQMALQFKQVPITDKQIKQAKECEESFRLSL